MDSSEQALERAAVLAFGVLVVVLGLWPWPLHPEMMLGEAEGEMGQHMAMLWKALAPDAAWMNWPEGFEVPVQDKVHLPLAWIAFSLNPSWAPALIVGVDLALAYAGGFWLSRELGADRLPATIGGAVLGSAPFLGAMTTFGFTECLPLGLLALHAAALLRLAKTGAVRWALLSSVLMVLYALSGWYLAILGLFAVPVLLVLCAQERPSRRVWALILAQGLLAALLVTPAAVDFAVNDNALELFDREIPPYLTGGPGVPEAALDWRSMDYGTDPLNYVLPTVGQVKLPRSVYLGLVALVLGLVGLRSRTGRVLGAGVLLFCTLGLGHYLGIAGQPLLGDEPLPTPVAAMTALVKPLQAIRHWYRAAGVAMVFLAPAAALAFPKGRWPALALAAAVLADGLLLGDAPWPRTVQPGPPPLEIQELPGDGPLLLLPFVDGARSGTERVQHRWLPFLERPIAENYEGPDALMKNPFVAWAHHECSVRRRRTHRRPKDLEGMVQRLRDEGLEVVAVVIGTSRWETCRLALVEGLGEPDSESPDVAWWSLAR